MTVALPGAAPAAAAKVIVLWVALAPMLAGLGVAPTFAGTPSAAMATAPAKPPARATVAVTATLPPCATLSALSESVSVMLP